MRLKNSGAANRILETPGELFAAARGENAAFPSEILFILLKVTVNQKIKNLHLIIANKKQVLLNDLNLRF